jgi:hypothetical protein
MWTCSLACVNVKYCLSHDTIRLGNREVIGQVVLSPSNLLGAVAPQLLRKESAESLHYLSFINRLERGGEMEEGNYVLSRREGTFRRGNDRWPLSFGVVHPPTEQHKKGE